MEIQHENSSNKINKYKQKINKYLIGGLILAILLGSMLFNVSCSRAKGLTFDYINGAVAQNRVETAQYLPDITNLIEKNSAQSVSNKVYPLGSGSENENISSSSEKIISNVEFMDLVNEYATVQNYAGAGKYLGYDIYEIKDEIAFVVRTVPAFNQWFRMPMMREEQGFISIPYYENWAYYLEMNEKASKLSITRVCWNTRSSYYDFEKHITVEDYSDGTSFIQYEVMKINYYYNEDGDEVVDCSVYSVGVDHFDSTYNDSSSDYYPFEYLYMQNVKDKSLIKYHITAAERTMLGMDIRGLYPYGYRREFTLVNYAGYGSSDIEMLQVDQYDNQPIDFDLNSNNIKRLIENIGLSQDKYDSSDMAFELMDKICEQIVDNFELKNNWPEIYKNSADAYKIDFIEGPFYGKPMPIRYLSVYTSCRDQEKNGIEFSANADILDKSKFDLGKEYSLSAALKSRDSGKLYIIGTDYQSIESVEYNYPDDYNGVKEIYYTLSGCNIDIESSVINIAEPGEYDLTCVLTVKENDQDVIFFDTLENAYLRTYLGLEIPDFTDSNGVTYRYTVSGINGKLTISVFRIENGNL